MGEAINLVNNFKVEKVIFNCGEFNELEQDLIKVLNKKKIPYYSCIKELNINDSKLYFLNSKDYGNENDNSNVIYTELNGYKFMFMGDAEETSEQDMISTGMNLDCDVLSVGHHGSASSTTWDFLEATSPSYAVISCGINNQYNHPSADTMGRLSDMGIPVFRTDKQGTIIAVSDGTNISWSQEPCNDYSSGDSSVNASAGGTGGNSWQEETTTSDPVPEQEESNNADLGTMVWIPATGEKYHSIPNCGRMNPDTPRQVSRSEAEAMGYGPCSKCY